MKKIIFFTISLFLFIACESYEEKEALEKEVFTDDDLKEIEELFEIDEKIEKTDEEDYQDCVDVEEYKKTHPSLWEIYSYKNEDSYPYTPQNATQENSSAEWELLSVDDVAGWEFAGDAELNGWIIDAPFYGNSDPEPHLCILEENRKNLPKGVFRRVYRLYTFEENEIVRISEEEINELREYTKENPFSLKINKLILPGEGTGKIFINN